jgi:hypothetical protein
MMTAIPSSAPEALEIHRNVRGIAGAYSISADVKYPGEDTERVTFLGSVYGGPIVMITPAGHQIIVSSVVMDRCGSILSEGWVRAFFA